MLKSQAVNLFFFWCVFFTTEKYCNLFTTIIKKIIIFMGIFSVAIRVRSFKLCTSFSEHDLFSRSWLSSKGGNRSCNFLGRLHPIDVSELFQALHDYNLCWDWPVYISPNDLGPFSRSWEGFWIKWTLCFVWIQIDWVFALLALLFGVSFIWAWVLHFVMCCYSFSRLLRTFHCQAVQVPTNTIACLSTIPVHRWSTVNSPLWLFH